MTVIALHGFLGSAKDWQGTYQVLAEKIPDLRFLAPDLFADKSLGPKESIVNWGPVFHEWLDQLLDQQSAKQSDEQALTAPFVLMGYSMGGRLALQALRANPGRFQKVFLLSTNWGIANSKNRDLRIQQDLKWSEKFLAVKNQEAFSRLMSEWNSQSVFSGDKNLYPEPERLFSDFSPAILSESLKLWSVGRQEYDSSCFDLAGVNWLFGERDKIYQDRLQLELPLEVKLNKRIIFLPQAGHRILFSREWLQYLSKNLG